MTMKLPIPALTASAAIFLCSLFFISPVFAQTFQIGANNGSNNAAEFPTPYGDSYEGMRAQYLYTAAELTAQGLGAGTISSIGFLVSDPNSSLINNFSIRLSNTIQTSLSGIGWEPAGSLVYEVGTYTPVSGGNLHLLDTPVSWDGTSNLLVEVCHNPSDPLSGDFTSLNASVARSTGLPFNASRTFAANDNAGVCTTTSPMQFGLATSRPVLLLRFVCDPPSNLTLNSITSVSAGFQFNPAPGGAASYQWEIGAQNYMPGTGTAFFTGTTSDSTFSALGLSSLTFYHVYIRTSCGNGVFSDWVGPLQFRTLPGCGEEYFDTGGLLEGYSNNQSYEEVICADSANHIVTLDFTEFNLAAGDTLRIFNGSSNDAPLMGTFAGSILPGPGPFTATTASGCLTVQFSSDSSGIGLGWIADITCARPDNCFSVLQPQTFGVSPFYNKAGFTWLPMFDARKYEWRVGIQPYSPSQPTIFRDSTVASSVVVSGLTEASFYDFWVRTLCKSGDSSGWVKVPFLTPPNCNAGDMSCGNSTWLFSSVGTGIYQSPLCAIPVPGKEKIVRFTAPNTKEYKLHVISTNNTGTYVGYFYKPVNLGCGPDNWQCIDDFNQPDSATFGPLVAGNQYFIRFESQNPAVIVNQTIRISGCRPVNDEAVDAISLEVDAVCSSNVYANELATIHADEPDPDVDPSDGLIGRWQNTIERTVWFKFIAPSSGTVQINTETTQGSNFDTQVALYSTTDPADYTTFKLLESDEDSGNTGLGYKAILTYTGLLAGAEYYIQVDDYGISAGTFCVEVLETGPRTSENNCAEGFVLANVDGTAIGGNHWYNIYTVPSIYEIGGLVAAIKPGPQDLDSVWCQISNFDSIQVSGNGIAYLPAYFNFKSKNAPVGPVSLRLFFYDSEFEALKAKVNNPSATIDDLNATHYRGILQDCEIPKNIYGPLGSNYDLITDVDGIHVGTSGTFYVELEIDSMGEVGVHLGNVPLPLVLKSFTGKIQGELNILEWETLTEKNVAWHIVERSADNIHWLEVGRRSAAGNSDAALRYVLDDKDPLARSYYRLRSVDFDGRTALSHSILLTRQGEAFGISAVFPSPTPGHLTMQYVTENEEDVTVRVVNFTGKIVEEQHAESVKGLNHTLLSLDALPSGTYTITVSNSSAVSKAIRVVKL